MEHIVLVVLNFCFGILFSWYRLLSQFFKNPKIDIESIPDDIIIDILSRLPADLVVECRKVCKRWQKLTSTSSFAQLQLIRATPEFIVSVDKWSREQDKGYLFIDEGSKGKGMMRQISLKYSWIIDSCNGFILVLLTIKKFHHKIFIHNPITHEEIFIPAPTKGGLLVGFFFHPLMEDYRILHHLYPGDGGFMIFSLQTKCWRRLKGFFFHHVLWIDHPILVDGTLHWMIYHQSIQINNPRLNYETPCSNSILRFNILTEEFDTMPHPEYKNCSKRGEIHLLDMDGQLCSCQMKPSCIDVWILQDYSKWCWVKRYKVSLECNIKPYSFPFSYSKKIRLHGYRCCITPICIRNGELWIYLYKRGLFRYNLQSGIVREVNYIWRKDLQKVFTFVPYTKTLVSLDG